MKVIGLAALLLLGSVWEVDAAASFTCPELLPEFLKPTEKQISDLCPCIWGKLPSSMRDLAIAVKREEEPFGKALDSCGGYKL